MVIKTFCDPFFRPEGYNWLSVGDLPRALKFFGPGLTTLYINPMYLDPKNKKFPKEFKDYQFPEDLIVEGHAGVGGWELMGEVREDKSSIAAGQILEVPEKAVASPVLNRPDKVLVAHGVIASPSTSPEYPPERNTSPDFDCSASNLEKSLKTSVKTPIIMKHGRGRPVDPHAMSKATLWRRAKKLANQQKEMLPL